MLFGVDNSIVSTRHRYGVKSSGMCFMARHFHTPLTGINLKKLIKKPCSTRGFFAFGGVRGRKCGSQNFLIEFYKNNLGCSMFENKVDKCDIQKKEIDTFRPLSNEQAQTLKEHFKIGLTYSSNALEGNTLTLIETKVIIEDGLTIGGKTLREIDEATGHARAYDFIFELIKNPQITLPDILKIHQLFYQNIDPDNAGKYRTKKVFISGMDVTLPAPEQIKPLMNTFEEELKNLEAKLHPIELAATFHNKFVTIHPFLDGNGRTARLLMNLILLKSGYSITIIPPIYRADYIACAYQGNKNNHIPFINLLSSMVYESQKEFLKLLKG